MEEVILHLVLLEHDLLHDGLIHGCVLHMRHLGIVVKEQRVIALTHKQVLHLPLRLLRHLCLAVSLSHPQGEDDALKLQTLVGCEIENKVIEISIGRPGHRSLCDELLQRVLYHHLRRVCHRVCRNLHLHACLLPRTGERQQQA